MPRPVALTKPNARPTMQQAFSIFQQLNVSQREALMRKQLKTLGAEMEAAAQRVYQRMEAAGGTITDAEIDAEVKAVRAARYAAQQ